MENRLASYFIPGSYSFMKPEIVAKSDRGFPLMLNVEPTLACNLRCFMCPTHNEHVCTAGIRRTGMMAWELYAKIIDECAAEGPVLVLNLHKDGESLLHPRFLDMIAYAKRRGAAEMVHFNTNATFDPGIVDALLDTGIDDITVSVDAFHPETFEQVKGRDLLPQVIANAERLLERRAQRNLDHPYIRVKMLGTEDLAKEFDLFHDYWADKADEVQVQKLHNFGGGLDFVERPVGARYPCAFPFYSTAVNWDGTVTLCHRDYNNTDVFGDVTKETLKQIYTGPKYRRYLRALIDGNEDALPICRTCDNWADGPDYGPETTQGLSGDLDDAA